MDTEQESAGGIRRWIKIAVIVVAVAVLITFVVMIVLGDDHGPARHFSAGPANIAAESEL
ncbi:hypothetical protein Rhe02_16900 [Rhizocola hellebori]|uniref:Uncharacterized protein n=1 Tax=Rhizocola hellebori TaxID=1392758 RepID=A0A8J3Q5F0_9ACTN|nr:hypothetical protein [Rhizocola hellebori]GIH03623.1 hypothetical protein Rhe02_16900 [Rhizocola hellebori]